VPFFLGKNSVDSYASLYTYRKTALARVVSAAVGCRVTAATMGCRVTATAMGCSVGCGMSSAVGDGTGMILRIAMARDVAAAAAAGEAMASPAVSIAPVGPGTDAKEDAVIEVP
jgi:hypothetical protein